MKYKFHELPETYEEDRDWSDNRNYTKEINWIAKNLNLDVNKFQVDDFTFGSPVVFYAGKYFGYLLQDFYYAMDTDDWKAYWEFDN